MRVAILGCDYVEGALGILFRADGHEAVDTRRSTRGLERVREDGLRGVEAGGAVRERIRPAVERHRVVRA